MLNTKSLSVVAILAVATAAKANNAIVATIQAAKSGQTVNVSGTYTGITTKISVPSGVKIQGPATFLFTTGASADGFYIGSSDTGVTLNSLTVEGANHGIICYGGSCSINSCIAMGNLARSSEKVGIPLRDTKEVGITATYVSVPKNADFNPAPIAFLRINPKSTRASASC